MSPLKNRPEKPADEQVAVNVLALHSEWTLREFAFLLCGRCPPGRGYDPGHTVECIAVGLAKQIRSHMEREKVLLLTSKPLSFLDYTAEASAYLERVVAGIFGDFIKKRAAWIIEFREKWTLETYAEYLDNVDIENCEEVCEARAEAKRKHKRTLGETPDKMRLVAEVLELMPHATTTAILTEISHRRGIAHSTANNWLKAYMALSAEEKTRYAPSPSVHA